MGRIDYHLSVPAGVVEGDRRCPTGQVQDVSRCLAWLRQDAAGDIAAVQSEQYASGQLERCILLCPDASDAELNAEDSRWLAAAILDAADALESLGERQQRQLCADRKAASPGWIIAS